MNEEVKYYSHLVSIMAKTRGARFTAAAGLRVKDRWSILTVATLSIYLLGWSVAAMSYPDLFTVEHARFYNAISAVASVALLSISLMDLSFARATRAEKFQANALEISELMRSLERLLVEQTPNVDKMRLLAVRYEKYVTQTAINHTTMDFQKWSLASQVPGSGWLYIPKLLRSILFSIWYYGCGLFVHVTLIVGIVVATSLYTVWILLPDILGR